MNDERNSLPLDAHTRDHDAQAPSSHRLDELALHGYRPFDEEPDPRSLRSPDILRGARIGGRNSAGLFLDIRLESDLPVLLGSFVNLFRRDLDDTNLRRNMMVSKIRSVELAPDLARADADRTG